MSAHSILPEPSLSIRLVWPFLRVSRVDPENLDLLTRHGIGLREVADPDTRLPHSLVMQLLDGAVARGRDLTIGLRAGERLEPSDLGVLEYAARSCPTLRGALACVHRYMGLVNGAATTLLEESGTRATWRIRTVGGLEQHPCANDFEISAAITLSRRLTGVPPTLLEVHLAHPVATSLADYERLFRCPVRLGMPENALVFERSDLDRLTRDANPGLLAAYSIHAEEELRRLERATSFSDRARAVLVAHLRTGDVAVGSVARALGTSEATLRRRLEAEGTTPSGLLDEVRRDLSAKYLADASLAITEVAFLLGFSHVPAYYKAFRRWSPGATPADFRRRLLRAHGPLLDGGASPREPLPAKRRVKARPR